MRKDRGNDQSRDNVEKNQDRGRPLRDSNESYSDERKRPVWDDVTDTLSPPARRDRNGGSSDDR